MPEPLDYARSDSAPNGRVGAIISCCIGVAVCAEALWLGGKMLRLDPKGDTEYWSVLGVLLLIGACAAIIGLIIAVLGHMLCAPNRLRLLGGLLNAIYLVGYATLIVCLALFA